MNSYEGKQGFLTFVTTVLISAGIFTSMYFLINRLNNRAQTELSKTDLSTRTTPTTPEVNGTSDTPSVFGALVEDKQEEKILVLGAGDQSTGSAVPSTGSSFIPALILIGGSLVLLGSYLSLIQPRKAAIRAFEKRITKGL